WSSPSLRRVQTWFSRSLAGSLAHKFLDPLTIRTALGLACGDGHHHAELLALARNDLLDQRPQLIVAKLSRKIRFEQRRLALLFLSQLSPVCSVVDLSRFLALLHLLLDDAEAILLGECLPMQRVLSIRARHLLQVEG